MKTGSIRRAFASIVSALVCAGSASAQVGPVFGPLQQLTNREVLLRAEREQWRELSHRCLDESAGMERPGHVTATSTNLQHTDSGAPFVRERYYRAEQLPAGTNVLTGDHLSTTNGDVIFHVVNHASFVMSWNGKMIYNDPVGGAGLYTAFPRADLILVSHSHSDHFDANTLSAVRGSNGIIVAPSAVFSLLSTTLRSNAVVLAYNASTNILGINIQAVAGYNGNHPSNSNNGYITTVGGKRIFTSGDSGNTPEFRGMTNIDVAFLCMNLPFTMNWIDATNSVRAFRPKVVYPYHYRDSGNTLRIRRCSNNGSGRTWESKCDCAIGIE
jgi:L-ascorbate metabolism protein UlaG (beta-lactamase superfamily)